MMLLHFESSGASEFLPLMVALPCFLVTRFAYSAIKMKTIDHNQYFAPTLIKRVSLEADQNRAKNGLSLAH